MQPQVTKMHMVMTKVRLKPGSTGACIMLFHATNPDLVRNEPDWLGARMVVDRENDTATVMATWRNIASYKAFSKSEPFLAAMGRFGPLFASPPEVTMHDLVVDMTPESIRGV